MKDIEGFIIYLKAQITTKGSSIKPYKQVAKDFINFMGKREKVTQDDINEFLAQQQQKYKNNSMINKVGGLRHYLRYDGYDIRRKNERENRGFLVKIPKAQATRTTKEFFLTEDEVNQIYKEASKNPYENAITKIFYHTEQRIGSIIALNIKDIDFERRTITFLKMKRGESRPTPHVVPVEDDVIQAIKDYIGTRTEGAVFLNRVFKTRLNDDQCRKQLKDISVRAGISR